MEFRKGKLLHDGKNKKVYSTNDPDHLIIHFKDDTSNKEEEKRGTIKKWGEHNVAISSFLFKLLETYNIHNHFVQVLKPNDMLVKKLEIIPLKVVMRNAAAGGICKRYGLIEGETLSFPILELYFKDDKRSDSMVNMDYVCVFGYATHEEMRIIDKIARKINVVLKSFFDRRDLKLLDLKLEFGRHKDQILLGDEISPNTCRIWDAWTGEKLGKDRFHSEKDDIEKVYQEVRKRICQ